MAICHASITPYFAVKFVVLDLCFTENTDGMKQQQDVKTLFASNLENLSVSIQCLTAFQLKLLGGSSALLSERKDEEEVFLLNVFDSVREFDRPKRLFRSIIARALLTPARPEILRIVRQGILSSY
ncbi:hypothetical protein P5673_001001 [Acropora cervicornis]|uniref:Uncharacterized protein n=1 Tax=Acropora cervicornis TaxID=6130 RepID=A0AAD9R5D0_ACRCE|nr:hypothetical protein P5673_001001 [Acropora cervicornis]